MKAMHIKVVRETAVIRAYHPMMSAPIRASYWVIQGELLAGAYPSAYDDAEARSKLGLFLDAGIRTFVDLTEETEPLRDYDDVLESVSAERGISCKRLRFGVRDRDVPTQDLLAKIVATIRDEIAAGRPVYVHCWGGIGRTGTIIGCWLVEAGLSGEEAIQKIVDLRRAAGDRPWQSPETEAQRRCICEWKGARDPGPGTRDPGVT
jgi:protein tyrosine/serine phosphatase